MSNYLKSIIIIIIIIKLIAICYTFNNLINILIILFIKLYSY